MSRTSTPENQITLSKIKQTNKKKKKKDFSTEES
jgi:transposase